MVGRIALVGGDEFRPGCEEMDRAILALTGLRCPSVLVVPTAAAKQNPSRAASNGVGYFSALDAEASALMVLGPDDANDQRLISPVGRRHRRVPYRRRPHTPAGHPGRLSSAGQGEAGPRPGGRSGGLQRRCHGAGVVDGFWRLEEGP